MKEDGFAFPENVETVTPGGEMMLAKSNKICPPSFANKDVICRCGFKSDKTGAHTGQKRRTRCNKCAGCTKPKCGICRPCTVPSMKKACEYRVCLSQKIPKCPCFQ